MELAAGVRAELLAHAREGAPEEVCGVLAGRGDRVTAIERVANVADTPGTRYELDPGEQVAAMRAIEERGEEVVGFYHSHPRGPPAPSATDERLATWPDHLYCIVSVPDESVRVWRWTGEQFDPVVEAEG
ncbi:desampylase [Halorarius halobius]|uniref:desampylase n=1 Tax=Halorarius halobius TaxID=2962671 RepID=UPI0020CD363D|nr:desampylase [Halorarius halobius]